MPQTKDEAKEPLLKLVAIIEPFVDGIILALLLPARIR